MPKRKTFAFAAVLFGLLVLIILCTVMSTQRFARTMLIPLDSDKGMIIGNETGMKEIQRQLDEFDADASTGNIIWTGSVSVTRYMALGGRSNTYYICPYLTAASADKITDSPQEWTLSLKFAICATHGDELISFNRDFSLQDITFTCRTGKDAAAVSAAFTDMDFRDENSDTVYYEFRDRDRITSDTEIFAKVSLVDKGYLGNQLIEKDSDNQKSAVIVNWTFTIEEAGRLVNNFDGIQVEIPYETVQGK